MSNTSSYTFFSEMTTTSSEGNVTSLPIVEDLCTMESMPDHHTYSKGI